jgi:glycosyltransferase involved in cell wall biosynthesis
VSGGVPRRALIGKAANVVGTHGEFACNGLRAPSWSKCSKNGFLDLQLAYQARSLYCLARPASIHLYSRAKFQCKKPRAVTEKVVPNTMAQEYLPNSVLYAISAGIGGIGLDLVAHETLRGIEPLLGKAISYRAHAPDIDRHKIKTLRFHPIRLLSNLDRKYYYAAKKRAVARVAGQFLKTGRFDLFHVWSGCALHSLRVAKSLGIPSLLEIPTWHRQKGKALPPKTEHEIAMENAPIPQRWLNRLLISRQESLEEYDLADLLLVESEKAADSFRVLGYPNDKLFSMPQGVDVQRFQPGSPPGFFRAVFVGALIKRKGVHTLIEAWKKLKLTNAELWLAGHPHDEIKPYLVDLPANVKVLGFTREVENVFRAGSVHVFPSSLEGSAKTTYEASACALAQITTREAGDVVVDGLNGIVIPPNDVEALASAIQFLYDRPDLVRQYGAAGRERVLEHFTWDHFRKRVLSAYRLAMARAVESRGVSLVQ